jgi:hypothetical protein
LPDEAPPEPTGDPQTAPEASHRREPSALVFVEIKAIYRLQIAPPVAQNLATAHVLQQDPVQARVLCAVVPPRLDGAQIIHG